MVPEILLTLVLPESELWCLLKVAEMDIAALKL
jgi:hypothetical protein